MTPQRCLPEPWPHVDDGVGVRGLKGGSLSWCGAAEAAPAWVLPGEPASSLCSSWSWPWHCSDCLGLRVLPWLSSPVLLGVTAGAAPTARAQVKGYKNAPLFLYTDKSPRAWATHKRDTLLGQAQNGARAGGAVFYRGMTFRALCFPRPARAARHGGVCVTWVACVGRFPHACVTSQ